MKIAKINCLIEKSMVFQVVEDLFQRRHIYGHGRYRQFKRNRDDEKELACFWAQTLSGRELRLRQVDPLGAVWSFSATFGNGSQRFSREVRSLLGLRNTQSEIPTAVSDVVIVPATD